MIDFSQKSPFYLHVHNRTCKSCSDRVARIFICFLRVFRQRRLDSCWRFNAKDYEGRFCQNWCFFLQEIKSLHFRGDQKLAKQIVNPPKRWAALTHRYSWQNLPICMVRNKAQMKSSWLCPGGGVGGGGGKGNLGIFRWGSAAWTWNP